MLRATELAGFIGAGLAGAAYVPQIWHLIRAHCSAGLSRVAFGAWLAASLLVTTHAVAIGATVFIALGAIQLAATALILIYTTKYEHSYCASHLPASHSRHKLVGTASVHDGSTNERPRVDA
ncbi:MAG: PQ-loop domain-containing transporter [Acidimicrobiales bacterium]